MLEYSVFNHSPIPLNKRWIGEEYNDENYWTLFSFNY